MLSGTPPSWRRSTRPSPRLGNPEYLVYIDPTVACPRLRSVALIESERRLGDEVTVERRGGRGPGVRSSPAGRNLAASQSTAV